MTSYEELKNVPGAGMGPPDSKLHRHALKAAKNSNQPDRAYADAAGDFCPECGCPKVESNGLPVNDPDLTYRCTACDHRWSPNEA